MEHGQWGSYRRTLTSQSMVWLDSSHEGASLSSVERHVYFKLQGCDSLSKANYEYEVKPLSS